MNIAHSRTLRFPLIALALIASVVALCAVPASANEVIVLRSGNAPAGNPDPYINMFVGTGGVPLSPNPFTASDFGQACDGPDAMVILQPPAPPWAQHLDCDLEAQWIGTDILATPASALFCQPFDIQTTCIQRATLSVCWATDDVLGDSLYGGPNPAGVYVNGVAVSPMITGGNYATQTMSLTTDVTSLVSTGTNYLQIYNRDVAFSVSGVIYSATLDITECIVPTETTTWGEVKSLFDSRELR
jgi:hypothetical protein